jgi:hypothetical protein
VRDAGGELAERGELLGLHQAILRGAQFVERSDKLFGAFLHLLEQPDILDGDHGLVGEGCTWITLPSSNVRPVMVERSSLTGISFT